MKPKPLSVSVGDASQWIGRWQLSDQYLQAFSFTFDADEFRALLDEETVDRVRLYVALEELADGTLREKLLVVGVNKEGDDVINPTKKPSQPGQNNPPGQDGSGIYDFSHPCPPICG
jgi:hypothetical protein